MRSLPIRLFLAHRDPELIRIVEQEVRARPTFDWVGAASSIPETRSACQTLTPDLLLIDSHLEALPTHELIASLRKGSAPIRIVGFAALEDAETIWAMLRAGANGYLFTSDPLPQILALLPAVLENNTVLSTSLIPLLFGT